MFAQRFSALLLVLVLFAATAWASPEIPGRPQERPIALVGGTVHPVSGPEIEATLLFDGGKIVAIGRDMPLPPGTDEIDIRGKHVYPGLFDAFTQLGLVEIGSVRATIDRAETGDINPNARAQIAFNPDSELVPVARSNGVLTVLSAPAGGLISGTSALMQLDGWTWEEMTLKAAAGVHVNWPRSTPLREPFAREPETLEPSRREKSIAAIRQAFADARAYQRAKQAASPGSEPPLDARWEAMLPVLEGKVPVVMAADEIQQIQAAVALAEQEQVRLIIFGGYDAPHCTELLKKHDVAVVVGGVYRLPQRPDDGYDEPFTVPRRLQEAGIRFCISGAENPWSVRNLSYHAAAAAAFGLSKDEALKAITLYPAQIFGVHDRIGSLESGKDATLVVADGDILEIPTQVEMAFIAGRKIDLSDRHKRLWHKYQEKYRRQEAAPRPLPAAE